VISGLRLLSAAFITSALFTLVRRALRGADSSKRVVAFPHELLGSERTVTGRSGHRIYVSGLMRRAESARSQKTFGSKDYQLLTYIQLCGCPAWIRTTIDGVRVRSLTIRRRGSLGSGGIESAQRAVNAAGTRLGLALGQ
jgi:hypothetical protein